MPVRRPLRPGNQAALDLGSDLPAGSIFAGCRQLIASGMRPPTGRYACRVFLFRGCADPGAPGAAEQVDCCGPSACQRRSVCRLPTCSTHSGQV
jgi:hypothetical protein